MDLVSKNLSMPVYYLRLPGHGTSPEDQARVSFNDLLDEAEEVLFMMGKAADRVYVCGTSMGASIALILAANYGHRISGIILVSPFYQFATPVNRLLNFPVIRRLFGRFFPLVTDGDPEPENDDTWTRYWYRTWLFSSIKLLTDLRRFMIHEKPERNINVPVLMFYYKKSFFDTDRSASAGAMKSLFARINSRQKKPLHKKLVRITRGRHVLMSRYFDADYEKITGELTAWLAACEKPYSM
jgi:pimeloyl-ACP methyl ester carboxylesterase